MTRAAATDIDDVAERPRADPPVFAPVDELTGFVEDLRDGNVVTGWALNISDLSESLAFLSEHADDLAITSVETGIYRPDLAEHADGRFGYRVEFSRRISALEFVAGNRLLAVRSARGVVHALEIEGTLHARLVVEAMNELWHRLDNASRRDREIGVITAAQSILPTVLPVAGSLTKLMNRGVKAPTLKELAPLFLPIGMRSGCNQIELGDAGQLFLTGGSTRVDEAYRQTPARARKLATRWLALMRERTEALDKRGIRYIQLVVPEKQSLLAAPHRLKAAGRTPVLTQLETMIGEDEVLRSRYVSVFDAFSRGDRTRVYRRVDTHMTPYGSRLIYAALAPALGHRARRVALRGTEHVRSGDLANRFFGFPVYETLEDMREEPWVAARTLCGQRTVDGKHIGRRYRWENPKAPPGPRVMAFGNSFMDDAQLQDSLSYWLAGNCRDYSFWFSPPLDYDAIDEFRPDIVIGQTIERFLHLVPDT